MTSRVECPAEKEQGQTCVMQELTGRLARQEDQAAARDPICRGTMRSRQQYLAEVNEHGYRDARELEVKGWAGDTRWPVKAWSRREN